MASQTGSIDLTASNDAAKTATNYIGIDSTGIRIANANPSTATTYQHLTATNTEFVAGGNTVATFGSTITLGNASDGSVVTIDSDSMDMVHGTTEMLHFGYGLGAAESGTANAPYYTVGIRAANSTVGNYSVAEGYGSTASAAYSHAEGHFTTASGQGSHAEGSGSNASGLDAHAEGGDTTASGNFCHAEGLETTASDMAAHAEGYNTTASEAMAHAEGMDTTASGLQAHAEGNGSTASGDYSHAEGFATTASGDYSHAQNRETVAASMSQTALGRYNVADANSTYAVIVGNGTSDSARSNALTVGWSGSVSAGPTVTARGTNNVALYSSTTSGDMGLRDMTNSQWIIYRHHDYGIVLGNGVADHLYARESTVTTNTTNVTQSGDNHCWNNGAVCSFVYRCAVKSALANGSELAVGTLPANYRPPYDMAVEVYTSTAVCVTAKVGTNGTITVKNVSGSSLATSVLLRISGTWAL